MKDREVNRFLRAAKLRLTSANLLHRNDLHLDSMYLAGYVPECALKAVILSRVPLVQRAGYVQEHFRGVAGHRYDYLRQLLADRCVLDCGEDSH